MDSVMLAKKFKWLNAFYAFLIVASPTIFDYLAGTRWVADHTETYGFIVLLVGLFTKFYKHEPIPETTETPIDTTQKGGN